MKEYQVSWRHCFAASLCGVLVTVAAVRCTASQQASVNTALASPPGQLFCAVATGAGPIVVGLVTGALTGPAAPLAVLATGSLASAVQADCAKAGGVPVAPPAVPSAAPMVAIAAPASNVAKAGAS